jgi:hypothetical protein
MFKLMLAQAILSAASTYYERRGDTETAKKLDTARKWLARFRTTRLALKLINGAFKLKKIYQRRQSTTNAAVIPFLPFLPHTVAEYFPQDAYNVCVNALPNVEFSAMQPYLCGCLESMQPFLPQQFDLSNLIDVASSSCGWEQFFAGVGNLEGM